MATETGGSSADETVSDADESGYSTYMRRVIVTTVASLFGMFAGVASDIYAGSAGDDAGLVILLAAIAVQLPLYQLLGMDVEDFGLKGNLYIAFMTFVLWFITWGIFLTTGALQ